MLFPCRTVCAVFHRPHNPYPSLVKDHLCPSKNRSSTSSETSWTRPPEAIVPGASLLEDLGADSLDITELVIAMEEAFNIKIADDEVQMIRTVQDAVDHVKASAGR